jgi:photosystem II stability/assembly factor-like uncharacterized protein
MVGGVTDKEDTMLGSIRKPIDNVRTLREKEVRRLMLRIAFGAWIVVLGVMVALVAGRLQKPLLRQLPSGEVHMAYSTSASVIYASIGGDSLKPGIYRSDDGGVNWQRMGNVEDRAVQDLDVDPFDGDVVYAGTEGGPMEDSESLWVSEDGGRSWKAYMLRLPVSPDRILPTVTSIAADPNQQGVLYVGTLGQGVYRFYDDHLGGYGYELVGGAVSPVANAFVNDLKIGSDGRVYALTSSGLFAGDGRSWEKLPLPELAASLTVDPRDPTILYAGGVSMGAYRSVDAGRTWQPIVNGLTQVPGTALRVSAITVDERHPNRVVLATSYGVGRQLVPQGIYESNDAGNSWRQMAEVDYVVESLSIHQGVVSATTENGLDRYGEMVEPKLILALPDLRALANPSIVQIIIMILAVLLAGMALGGRMGGASGHQGLPAA